MRTRGGRRPSSPSLRESRLCPRKADEPEAQAGSPPAHCPRVPRAGGDLLAARACPGRAGCRGARHVLPPRAPVAGLAGHGVTVGVLRRMHTAHAPVRDTSGELITDATWNAVIGIVAGCSASWAPRRPPWPRWPPPSPRSGRPSSPSQGYQTSDHRPRPGRLRPAAPPARVVIDRHGNDGGHTWRSCGLTWPCFELGTAIGALDLVPRVHVVARQQPHPLPGPQRTPPGSTRRPTGAAGVPDDTPAPARPDTPTPPTRRPALAPTGDPAAPPRNTPAP
jgi:hypothetical protein